MYGPTSGEWGCMLAFIAIVGGVVCVGLWELGQWVFAHLTVGWQ
jgi:hypothetical protein